MKIIGIEKVDKNHRIQMKISHKDDRYESLHFFENINKNGNYSKHNTGVYFQSIPFFYKYTTAPLLFVIIKN